MVDVLVKKETVCLCGSVDYYQYNKQLYVVASEGNTVKKDSDRVYFVKCEDCGVVRLLNLPFFTAEEFYKNYPPANVKYKVKGYDHDRELAKKRADKYLIKKHDVVLDIGSGNGAFVDECNERGAVGYGCELAEYVQEKEGSSIYRKKFEDIHFPTDNFDVVTCHDVLEHVLDPVIFIDEMFRVTKQNGACVVDFPDFFCEEGEHHWKEEHIWFFSEKDLFVLFRKTGFVIEKIEKPISSKTVIYLKKPKQNRTKILVPPGMGDVYWSIVKMESFLKQRNLGKVADIYVACNKERHFDAHKRAFPFLKLFPFLKSTEIAYSTDDYSKKLWLEAYDLKQAGRTVFKNICGCDYFLSWNAHLGAGRKMEEVDPELECNWFPSMFESLEQINYEKEMKKKHGKYIVFYFIFHGHYTHWLSDFPIYQIVSTIKSIVKETGCVPVLTGAVWDKENNILNQLVSKLPVIVDLRGKTSLEQLFGLMKGSEMVVGYPSGLTIMSTVLKVKTLMIWNKFYNSDFVWNSCPPQTKNVNYFVDDSSKMSPEYLTNRVKEIIKSK
ncbi:MAG: methyltransferase domain-containing protein [Gammaproteobacteria bacterium]|nr:methyltransferase domain-containing protein [Gammaproteobacteria bacterium]